MIKARDPSFDVGHFLGGAKAAYQMIVTAFAKGDREALRPLLSPSVMQSFEQVIETREREGREETVEFLHPPRADFETAALPGDNASASVRFLAEIRAGPRARRARASTIVAPPRFGPSSATSRVAIPTGR